MQLFSARQKGQLDVYGLWGCLRGQLLTDDSFVFNRVLSRLKDSVSRLPDATSDDDVALTRLKVWARAPLPRQVYVVGLGWGSASMCMAEGDEVRSQVAHVLRRSGCRGMLRSAQLPRRRRQHRCEVPQDIQPIAVLFSCA